MTRMITVTSGKGGVGKTNVSLNLAVYLSKKGYRTCLFDADLGLANVNILLGLQPEYDLKDVILNGRELQDIVMTTHEGVDIVPGSSGIEEAANLGIGETESLLAAFSAMAQYDFLLFDTSAGISRHVISFCLASSEVIIIITPEPTSLVDAYALLKILKLNEFEGEAKVVLNQCKNLETAKLVYQKFKSAAAKHLGVDTPALGVIYQDEKVAEAVRQQRPFLSLYPNAKASKCIEKMGERILSAGPYPWEEMGPASFFRKCLKLICSPLSLPGGGKGGHREGPEPPSKKSKQIAHGISKTATTQDPNPTPEDHQEVPNVRTGPSRDLEDAMGSEHSLMEAIEKLNGSISSVSKELRLIRELVQDNGRYPQHPENPGQLNPSRPRNRRIRLDLKAFLEQRSFARKE